MLSDWWLGARMVDTSDQHLVHLPGYCSTELPKAYKYEWDLWLSASSGSSRPPPCPPGLLVTANIFFTELTSYHHGCKGVHHRRLQLWWWPLPEILTATPRGPPLMSSPSVVAAAGTAGSTPRGFAIDVSLNLVTAARIFLVTPTRGPPR
jgi:hypothetical protein